MISPNVTSEDLPSNHDLMKLRILGGYTMDFIRPLPLPGRPKPSPDGIFLSIVPTESRRHLRVGVKIHAERTIFVVDRDAEVDRHDFRRRYSGYIIHNGFRAKATFAQYVFQAQHYNLPNYIRLHQTQYFASAMFERFREILLQGGELSQAERKILKKIRVSSLLSLFFFFSKPTVG